MYREVRADNSVTVVYFSTHKTTVIFADKTGVAYRS